MKTLFAPWWHQEIAKRVAGDVESWPVKRNNSLRYIN
jgi:hypothetical protein